MFDNIGKILDNRGQVDTIYPDMAKAFDRIIKVRNYSFGGSLLKWLQSYLIGGHQRVTACNHQLQTTDTERDLGVCVSSDLTWKVRVHQQANKANKILGYIRRNPMFITRYNCKTDIFPHIGLL